MAAIPEPGTVEHFLWLTRPHKNAPFDVHLRTLFDGVRIGNRDFLSLMQQAIGGNWSKLSSIKVLRRYVATLYLIRYFAHARAIPGAWAECGVYSGTSALALCLAARAEDASFDGAGLHLVDSFEGLSTPVEEDLVVQHSGDAPARAPVIPVGNLRAPVEIVTAAMSDFPGVCICKGWIAPVFADLPETTWSFVHLDVDLHDPTLESLRYFEPRLAPGGVIICDDYGAPTFPGAARAWDYHFSAPARPFVVLPTGQAVFVRNPV